MESPLSKTVLYEEHLKLGGKMANFAGWSMPLWYQTGQIIEHHATRKACGLFDICHMGEFEIQGPGSQAFLSNLLTNNVDKMSDNQAMYNFLLNDHGGVIDDCILYRYGRETWMLVVNAGNIEIDFQWLESHKPANVYLKNISDRTVKLDIQGPNAPKLLSRWIESEKLMNLKFFRFIPGIQIDGISVMVSRTGYTGEIGFELYVDIKNGIDVWNLLLSEGRRFELLPCGLGARDTLRTEAGLPLHGHELRPDRLAVGHPWEFAIDWGKEFIGKSALSKKKEEGFFYFVLPFIINGRRKAMPGWDVLVHDQMIGTVLSGVISPTLNNIPIGFLGTEQFFVPDTKLTFQPKGHSEKMSGKVTTIPFIELTSRKKMSSFLL